VSTLSRICDSCAVTLRTFGVSEAFVFDEEIETVSERGHRLVRGSHRETEINKLLIGL
jgi:hypothetical protein